MHQLIHFELRKIWCKRNFVFSVCILLILNVFLLWYTSLPDENTPELSAYKKFQSRISVMTETEKAAYLSDLKENIDGISFVQEISSIQNTNNEMGNDLAKQAMRQHPGVFEKYYDLYKSAKFLIFTDSLEKEKQFIDKLYDEQVKVAAYDTYLKTVQNSKEKFSSISIFENSQEDTFSARNIKKSAFDYSHLKNNNIRWTPSEMIVSSTESIWTDMLLILLMFLFVGGMITEEKEKGLFYITRSTKYGITQSIFAKLSALLIHNLIFTVVFYCTNYLFFGLSTGWCDVTAGIQSIATYMESNLSVSILEYIVISVFTKGIVLFVIGTILSAFCVLSNKTILPYLIGCSLCGVSFILYTLIPQASKFSFLKYLNIIGFLKTENLYGAYLNFNLFGYPVSRLHCSWILIALLAVIGITITYISFNKGSSLQSKRTSIAFTIPFKPYSSLIRHESYKILIMNRALIVLVLFSVLIGGQNLSEKYTPSAQELYYQDIMLQLEGKQTDEKTSLILTEQTRYQDAFSQIEKIDEMISNGTIDENVGDTMKSQWYSVTAFYPAFQRVVQQYDLVYKNDGNYIYDTGYLYLFGAMGNDFVLDLLLLSVGFIFAFSNVVATEYRNGSLHLLYATKKGKFKIIMSKMLVCSITASIFAGIPFICRFVSISKVFPMHGFSFSVNTIPYFQELPFHISIGGFVILFLLSQILSALIITSAVILISMWRKNYIQTVFFSLLIFAVPLILAILGFDFAKLLSVYPIYSWSVNV